jgi:hypothetical protein
MTTSWQQAALFNTVLIEAHSASGNESWKGTGFFVLYVHDSDSELFVVSNRHVLQKEKGINYTITLHRKSTSNSGLSLTHGKKVIYIDPLAPIKERLQTEENYYGHPDKNVDLACIKCSNLLARNDAVIVPLSQAMILDWDKSNLYPTQPVMFVGYPDGIIDRAHNLPVARCGAIASMPMLDFDGRPNFLIDAQVWPGSSGSPVFVAGNTPEAPFSLVGVVHSTQPKRGQPDTLIGLGYAVKSSELAILFNNIFRERENSSFGLVNCCRTFPAHIPTGTR